MIRVSGVVTLADGVPVRFVGGPREFSAWERYAISHGLPTGENAAGASAGLTMMWYLAYACSTRGAEHRPGFDDWLGELVDCSEFDLELPPPTRPVASDASSDSSPSQPESDPPTSGPPTRATSLPSSTS